MDERERELRATLPDSTTARRSRDCAGRERQRRSARPSCASSRSGDTRASDPRRCSPPPESGLLLTGAGMEQFIPYFLGQAEPPFTRATSVQKCFRANDIENVGRHRPAPHAVRDARQLLVRGLLQGGVVRVGPRARHAGVRDRPRPPVDDGVRRRRRGGRHLEETWGSRRTGSCVAARLTTTGGRTPPARRAVLGDLRRPRIALRPRGRPRGRRGSLLRDLEPRVHAAPGRRRRARCSASSPNKNIDTGSSVERVAMVLQDKGELLRDRPVRPAARGGAVPVGQATTAPTSSTTWRSGSSASTRERRRSWWPTGSSRRTRGAGTSCGGCSAVWSRASRRLGVAARGASVRSWRVVVDGFGDAYPGAPREPRVHRGGARLGGGSLLGDPASGDGAVRRCAGPGRATAWSRATTRSSCPTRSASRSS